jgi:hypothetical protein
VHTPECKLQVGPQTVTARVTISTVESRMWGNQDSVATVANRATPRAGVRSSVDSGTAGYGTGPAAAGITLGLVSRTSIGRTGWNGPSLKKTTVFTFRANAGDVSRHQMNKSSSAR